MRSVVTSTPINMAYSGQGPAQLKLSGKKLNVTARALDEYLDVFSRAMYGNYGESCPPRLEHNAYRQLRAAIGDLHLATHKARAARDVTRNEIYAVAERLEQLAPLESDADFVFKTARVKATHDLKMMRVKALRQQIFYASYYKLKYEALFPGDPISDEDMLHFLGSSYAHLGLERPQMPQQAPQHVPQQAAHLAAAPVLNPVEAAVEAAGAGAG